MDAAGRASVCFFAGVLLCASSCGAQEGASFEPAPASALAWWAVDPLAEPTPAEAAQRQFVESALRATLSSGLVEDEDAIEAISGLLIASAVGGSAHRVVLQDVGVSTGADGVERVSRLRAVLEIRGRARHRDLVRTIQSILVDGAAGGDDPGAQRAVDLGEGREGVAFRRASWPGWLEVSWASEPGAFYVGIGRGALEGWFEAERAGAKTPWTAHRTYVGQRTPGTSVMEVFVNFDGLRRAAPRWFGRARAGRLLGAWDLSNARLFMVHARLVPAERVPTGTRRPYGGPPVLAVEATWESRSDPPGTVRHRAVTATRWPDASVAMEPPPGHYVLLAPTRALAWIDRGVRTYVGLKREAHGSEFLDRARRWARGQQQRIARLQRASAPVVVVSDSPRAGLGHPMLATVYVEVDRGISLSSYERELGRVMDSLGEQVVFDEATRTWSVRVLPARADPAGTLSVLAWGMAEGRRRPVLVVGWSRAAVEAARRRLAGP